MPGSRPSTSRSTPITRVERGETVLIFGATGAVGTLAVQFAASRGARVIATATGRKARSLVRSLGANAVIDARSDDAVDALLAAAPNGVDVVLAFAGGKELARQLDAMPRGARVVYPNGIEPEPKRRKGIRMRSYDAAVGPEEFTRLARAAERARLRVPIAGKYSLSHAADAHRRIEHEHVLGRIVISVRRGEN
jgi:NADPH2:quinone reductase